MIEISLVVFSLLIGRPRRDLQVNLSSAPCTSEPRINPAGEANLAFRLANDYFAFAAWRWPDGRHRLRSAARFNGALDCDLPNGHR